MTENGKASTISVTEQLHMGQNGLREASFELLRILAMAMIVALHYLSKGGILVPLSQPEGMNGPAVTAWVLEAMCLPAVNLYLLISGYFGCQTKFRLSKVFRLWGVMVFYSVLLTLLLGWSGNLYIQDGFIGFSQFSIYNWMNVIFPLVTEEYWFVTAYLLLCLLMPFLNAGIERLSKKELQNILLVLFVIFSLTKTILPMDLPTDQKGYDVLWFVFLYLLGGYFRLYGCPLFTKAKGTVLYLISVFALFGTAFAARGLYLRRGMLADLVLRNHFYSYNYLFCLTAAIGLFGVFTAIRIRQGGGYRIICTAASCTLAVYLIHEQLYLRYLWPQWFHVSGQAGKWTFLPHMLGTVTVVLAAGILIEWCRKKVTAFGVRVWIKRREGK